MAVSHKNDSHNENVDSVYFDKFCTKWLTSLHDLNGEGRLINCMKGPYYHNGFHYNAHWNAYHSSQPRLTKDTTPPFTIQKSDMTKLIHARNKSNRFRLVERTSTKSIETKYLLSLEGFPRNWTDFGI